MSSDAIDITPFGELLRRLRTGRRYSQAALAADAQVSARHLSFLENGRAKPSREMVLVLGSALDLPLRERNLLLRTAGFTPAYVEGAPEGLAAVRRSLDFVLERMAPNGVAILDRQWNVLEMNRPLRLTLEWLLGAVPADLNMMRDCFDPARLRPYIGNFDDIAPMFLDRLRHEALVDGKSRELLDAVGRFPPVKRGKALPSSPIVPLVLQKGPISLSIFSTIAVLGTVTDPALDELRIETYFPADEPTATLLRQLLAGS